MKNRSKRKFWVISAALLLFFIILIAGGRVALKSNWLFDIVRDIAVNQANQQLNGTVFIESIRGDLLNGFVVHNIEITGDDESQIAEIDSIAINYTLSSLIRPPYTVDTINLFGTTIWATQYEDSSWNLQNLIGEFDEPEEEPEPIFWAVNQIDIQDMNVRVRSDFLLPDGFMNVNNLNASVSGGILKDGYFANLESLELQLEEGRLPEKVEFYLSAGGNEEKFTLESLVVQTGRTILSASASYEQPGKFNQSLELSPLSWRDLILYADDLPLRQDLSIQLGIEGTLDAFELRFNASATGMDKTELKAGFQILDEPALKKLDLQMNNLNLPLLTGLDNLPHFKLISFAGKGDIKFENLENALFHGKLTVEQINFEPYKLDRLTSDLTLENGELELNTVLVHHGESINLNLTASRFLEEVPEWQASLNAGNVNLANWAADEDLDSELNLNLQINGSGLDPEQFQASITAIIEGNRFGSQKFSRFSFDGLVDPQNLSGDLAFQLHRGLMEIKFSAVNWQDIPGYLFELQITEFDLAEIEGLDVFQTRLNGSLRGEGRSFDTETLYLAAEMAFDSSIVNNEIIDVFRANLKIEDEFIFVDNGMLRSPIADAELSIRQHISDFLNLDNRLQFDARIKDLYPIKPLIGVDELNATGVIRGNIARNNNGILKFDGYADFDDIMVDTLFSSTKAIGSAQLLLQEIPELSLDLSFSEPSVLNVGVQDVKIHTTAKLEDNQTTGLLNFQVLNGNLSSIIHEGEFFVDSTQSILNTTGLTLSARQKTLSLIQPFELSYKDNIMRMDTLVVTSGNEDAYLRLWIPHLDSTYQKIGVATKNLNLGELQEVILEESLLEGLMSGYLEVANSSDNLKLSSSIQFFEIGYEGTRLDSLQLNAFIADEWLDLDLNGWNEDNKLIEGHLRVPFIAGDPATFDDRFFEREISGKFQLYQSSLEYWLGFIPGNAAQQTAGNITIDAELNGVAGSPELTGTLEVEQGLFSGIRVEKVGIDLNYLHDEGNIDLSGSVTKDQRHILSFQAVLPFLVDLRQTMINVPSDEDDLFMSIKTNDFDIALFNSYVDQELLRSIAGRLDGDVTITGNMANPVMNGEMRLNRGNIRVVPAGITLSEMAASILFEPDRVVLSQFTTRSGPGRLRAVGSVELDALQPGKIDIELTANQFRAINTPEYNFLINLNTKMDGTFTEPRLRGELRFLAGQVNLQNFGDRAVEVVVLEEEEETEPFDFFNALTMELNVDFGRQFFVRSRQYLDLEFFLSGNLDLLKQKDEELQMFGTLEGLRGFARPLGRNFEMDEVAVAFFGPVDDPQLNVRTRYEPPQAPGVHIFYVIDGTLQDPEFRFESEPELELKDILSYTLFGKPFYELDSWEQVVAGSGASPSVADLALDVLLDRVEMLASQRLGIDVVQIDNTRSGSRNTTSIKTGWYLNQRTFFAILNEVGGARPRTLFMLEYLLMDNLELIITQGDDSREGIDLRWRLDY